MSAPRPWCEGAGKLSRPWAPSCLVTCPDCGRPNLNSEEPAIRDERDGERVVPVHRESARAREWRAKAASAANERRAAEGV